LSAYLFTILSLSFQSLLGSLFTPKKEGGKLVYFHFPLSTTLEVFQSPALFSIFSVLSPEMIKLDRTEAKQLMIKRFTHIQSLAKQKKYAEIEALVNNNYV
jgi:hypothetical protein